METKKNEVGLINFCKIIKYFCTYNVDMSFKVYFVSFLTSIIFRVCTNINLHKISMQFIRLLRCNAADIPLPLADLIYRNRPTHESVSTTSD